MVDKACKYGMCIVYLATLAVGTPLCLHLFCCPSSHCSPSCVEKFGLQNSVPPGGGQLAFNTLTTSQRPCIRHRWSGWPLSGQGTFDSNLLISLYSNLPTLYCFIPCWFPTTQTQQIASLGYMALSLDVSFFLCCSRLLFPLLLASPVESWLNCFDWDQVCPSYTPSTYRACPATCRTVSCFLLHSRVSPAYIPSHAHT